MLAARFHEPGDVRVEEVPDPASGPGDVVIRVRGCGPIASGAVPVTDLITHHFPLAQFASALAAMASGQAIKVTIEP